MYHCIQGRWDTAVGGGEAYIYKTLVLYWYLYSFVLQLIMKFVNTLVRLFMEIQFPSHTVLLNETYGLSHAFL